MRGEGALRALHCARGETRAITDEPDNLVLRYLRRLDEKIDRVEGKVDELASLMLEEQKHIRALLQTTGRHEDAFAATRLRLDHI